ncbi:MAG: hypothetical protein HYY68_05385 [Thaumarchaeota archaeon]|nr:hypothetical protein [Nitrososphaerota archaeon]
MGSAFAAVKAGILGGIFYAGITGLFNLFVVFIFKNSALSVLSKFQECSGITAGGPVSTPNECFSALISVLVPYSVFIIFLVSLVFSSAFGIFFESLPGRSYATRASIVAFIMVILLLYTGFEGISFDIQERAMIATFNFIMAYLYATILGSLYKRYTRVIEFSSQNPELLRIILGRKDVTGKTRTVAANSSVKVRASPLGNAAFKEWSYSGGVTLEDSKSFETVMRVAGDGMLKASLSLTQV